MTDAQLQPIADAAASFIISKLTVPVEFGPVAPKTAASVPREEICQACRSVKPIALVSTTEGAMTTQNPAQYIQAECKGPLQAIVGQLNLAGGPIYTHPLPLPDGAAKALGLQTGLMVRAIAQYDIATGYLKLRFDVLYSKK